MEDYTVDVSIDPSFHDLAVSTLADECDWLVDDSRVEDYLVELVGFLLSRQEVRAGAEVSVTLATDERVHELNREHRGIDRTTDVLSFPCDEPDDMVDEVILLGDIVIAPAVAWRQSREYGTTFLEELTLLTTHGVLHLLGYDHIEDDEAEVMEARERELREAWWEGRR